MSTFFLGEGAILEIGSSLLDVVAPNLTADSRALLIQSMDSFLKGIIPYEHAHEIFLSNIGRTDPLDRLKEITDVPLDPLPEDSGDIDNISRKKTRSWTDLEDTRLLAGIYRYGPENWTTISAFVGNGRSRAQCCQRWSRGLNPRISKDLWTYEEDIKLIQLVQRYGDKCWTKVASMMGNRSDVQCRYHYHQVIRDMPQLLKEAAYAKPMIPNTSMLPIRVNAPGIPIGRLSSNNVLSVPPQFYQVPTQVPNLIRTNCKNSFSQPNFTPPVQVPLDMFPSEEQQDLIKPERRSSMVPMLPRGQNLRPITGSKLSAHPNVNSHSSLDEFLRSFQS